MFARVIHTPQENHEEHEAIADAVHSSSPEVAAADPADPAAAASSSSA
jgi:hypothetical protein